MSIGHARRDVTFDEADVYLAPDRPLDGAPAAVGRSNLALALVALLIVASGAVAAYVASAGAPDRFGAEVDLVYPIDGAGGGGDSDRLLATQTVVITGPGVLGPIAAESGRPLEDVQRDVTASVVGGSEVIRVRATADDREAARALAQRIAEQYVTVQHQAPVPPAQALLEKELTDVQTQLSATAAELDQVRAATPVDRARERTLQDQVSALTGRQSALQEQLVGVQVDAVSSRTARIVAPARPLDQPVEPQPLRSAALGAVIGVVIAAGVVSLLLANRNRRLAVHG